MRLIIAGIVGGVVMFAWGAVSHMMLGVGEAGIKPLPNESEVVSSLKANITEPGLYFVPGMDMTRKATDEEMAAWQEKYSAGPTAFLVYHPTGEVPMSTSQLGIEFASNVLAALVGAFILSLVAGSFITRTAAATAVGLAGWLSINVSYWDWYRFPGVFVASELTEQAVGWLLSGLIMALILKRRD